LRYTSVFTGFYNYSPIGDPETGEVLGTYSIVTRPANDVMKKIHNSGENKHRMPLFVQKEKALEWIREDLTDEQIKEFTAYEIPSEDLEYSNGLIYHRWERMK